MRKLLVVDDESAIRRLYSLMLADEGYRVETAASASEAEKKLAGSNYDLMVLDIKLGNENGLDLLQKITRSGNDLPVILCSAFSCYMHDLVSWVADGYVVKSSDPQKLKDEIARVLLKRPNRRVAEATPAMSC